MIIEKSAIGSIDFEELALQHPCSVWMFSQASARFVLAYAFDHATCSTDDLLRMVRRFLQDAEIQSIPRVYDAWSRLDSFLSAAVKVPA